MKHYKLTDTQHKSIDKLLKYFKLFPEYTQWDWDGVTWVNDRIIEFIEDVQSYGAYSDEDKYWLNVFREQYYEDIKRLEQSIDFKINYSAGLTQYENDATIIQ